MFFVLEGKKLKGTFQKQKLPQNKLVIIHHKIQFRVSMPSTFALK